MTTTVEFLVEKKLVRAQSDMESTRLTNPEETRPVQLTYWELDELLRALRFGATVRAFVKP